MQWRPKSPEISLFPDLQVSSTANLDSTRTNTDKKSQSLGGLGTLLGRVIEKVWLLYSYFEIPPILLSGLHHQAWKPKSTAAVYYATSTTTQFKYSYAYGVSSWEMGAIISILTLELEVLGSTKFGQLYFVKSMHYFFNQTKLGCTTGWLERVVSVHNST